MVRGTDAAACLRRLRLQSVREACAAAIWILQQETRQRRMLYGVMDAHLGIPHTIETTPSIIGTMLIPSSVGHLYDRALILKPKPEQVANKQAARFHAISWHRYQECRHTSDGRRVQRLHSTSSSCQTCTIQRVVTAHTHHSKPQSLYSFKHFQMLAHGARRLSM